MKRIFFFIAVLAGLTISKTQAQNVLWADKVIEYSSQLGEKQYSAEQVTGKPNVLPNLGLSPNAWMPSKKSKNEYIKVSFPMPINVQQIAIAETFNPGSIRFIYAYDENGREYLLNEFIPKAIPIEGRLLRVFIEMTPYKVKALKIVADIEVVKESIGIDAIAISDSRDPITVDINLAEDINNDYIPVALDSNVNTTYNELRPLLSPDGSTLFFSRQNSPENIGGEADDEDIWISKRDSATGNWLLAENIGRPLNNKGPNFVNSISSDGNTLLLGNAYYGKDRMTQGISMSSKDENGNWTKPVNLHIKNDYNKSKKANYFMTHDQQAIVMAVERDDTRGDRDLYVIFSNEDGTWTEPLNLGEVLNSADEEGSPFLASDGKTLFFSSKGFSGFGGFDIYLSRRLDDSWTNWSEPENLGAAFNSREDDIFFNFTENDEYAYFARGTTENTDIYKVKLPYYQKPQMLASLMDDDFRNPNIIVAVFGKVYNAKTNEAITASLEFSRAVESPFKESVESDSSDGYRIILKEGFMYEIEAKARAFYAGRDSVDLGGITQSIEIEKNLYLNPIEKGKPIVLENVNFDFDRDNIRKDAEPVLDRLVEIMNDNPDFYLSIEGHTCWMGSEPYNQNLSERRAGSVVKYIHSKGIPMERLSFAGYGELKPRFDNETKEGREKNRRVEFQIDDKEDPVTSNMR